MCANGIPQNSVNGVVSKEALSEEDAAHLHSQINQWVSCYSNQLAGHVAAELISRGVLRKPDADRPLTDGVFGVAGEYIAS